MSDQVKLRCIFDSSGISYLSPVLDLYTCNSSMSTTSYHPPNIFLIQNGNGDIPYNIYDYIQSPETKTKCYWEDISLNLW